MKNLPPLPPRSLCLIRHGETTANRDAIIAGRLNVSLTEQGRNQARALAQTHWPEPITVFCSPMERACETAHLGFPMSKPTVISGLHERDWGIFEGQPLSELPPRDRTPKDGEGWRDMVLRVHAAITEVCSIAVDSLPVLVCHSGVIRATRLLAKQEGVGIRPGNARPILFDYRNGDHAETPLD